MSVSKPPAGPDSHWKSVSFRGHHYGYIAVPAVTTSLDRCIYKASDLDANLCTAIPGVDQKAAHR